MKIKDISDSSIIILVGILFSLWLQGQVVDGVYFSGDGGLKALLAQQLGRGELRFDLIPPQEAWIQNLWRDGLYPYQEPFVYDVNHHYYITFPYTFPLVTAPFYALFGYRGLYLIPLGSTWVIWLTFAWVCRKFKLNNLITSIGLVSLIFTSFLTIYSGMYWEHTLAVALCFAGMAIFLSKSYLNSLDFQQAILSGCLIGLAVWFRPEFLCMVGLLTGLVILVASSVWFKKIKIARIIPWQEISYLSKYKISFIVSMFLTGGAFFLSNQLIYSHFLGIHGIQVVEQVSLGEKLLGAWKTFQGLSLALFDYLPIIYLPVLYLAIYLSQKIRAFLSFQSLVIITILILLIIFGLIILASVNLGEIKNIVKSLLPLASLGIILLIILRNVEVKFNLPLVIAYLFCFGFIIGVALLVPVGTAGLIAGGKQWGPRFLMILIPIIAFLAAIALNNLISNAQILARVTIFSFLGFLIALGVHQNIYQAILALQKNNQETLPAVEFLKQDSHKIIAMSHQFVGQALEPAVNQEKIFFRVEEPASLVKLSQALITQQKQEYLYICYPNRACELPNSKIKFSQDNQEIKLNFSSLGKFGKYPIYKIKLDIR
jgi:hypothetical protein